MPQQPDYSRRSAKLYTWLADREQQALDSGGPQPWTPEAGSWDGSPERLERFRNRQPVDIPQSGIPSWARDGERIHWWYRAVVYPDGRLERYNDDGRMWLTEAGL